MKLRLLADDLTGALDSAAAFAGDVPVHLDAPPADDANAIGVVATASRDVAPASLPTVLTPSLGWLRGADIAFKKVDSLLRGNTFVEVAWLARSGGFARTVFAPAFPQQGRLTVDGRLWLAPSAQRGAQCVSELSMAERLTNLGVPEPWVPDVRSDDDLQRIAALSLHSDSRHWLWCGSAGLAQALARAHGLAASPAPLQAAPSPLLLVSASHHEVVRRQWAVLHTALPDVPLAVRGDAKMIDAVLSALRRPCKAALLDLAPANPLSSAAEASALLARQLDVVVASAPRPGALIVMGGDTLRALCRATGARSLLSQASPRPGWGRARWVGGCWEGVECHSRSGAFGADDDLLSMISALS